MLGASTHTKLSSSHYITLEKLYKFIIMGLGEEGSKDDQGTRSKGIFSSTFSMTLGGGGGGGGYPAHHGQHYPVNGSYVAPAPPPGAYHPGAYGGHHQAGYNYNHHSPPHHAPNNPASCQPGYNNSYSLPHHASAPPAYGAYPNSYGGHGGGGHGGYGGYGGYHGQHHEQQHVDYYHRREEINMYQQQGYGAPKPHGYGKFPFGIVRRGISDAKV